MRNLLHHIWRLPRNAIRQSVRIYQATLSPDHGPLRHLSPYGYCRHEPTCSMYALDCLERRGAVIGSLLALQRILTCHPFHRPDDRKIARTIERHFPSKP